MLDLVPWHGGEGNLFRRSRMDHDGRLLIDTHQPDRDEIMADTAERRKDGGGRDLSFGRLVGRIPTMDYYQLQKTHPQLFNGDAEQQQKAWVKFINGEGREYMLKKA